MDDTAQESTRRKYDGFRRQCAPVSQEHAGHGLPFHQEIGNFTFDDVEVLLSGKLGLHGKAIDLPIRLRPRALNGWPLTPVEQAKLDAGPVCDAAHDAIQRINFPYEMPFAKPPDSRVAAHHANRVCPQRYQSGACAGSCSRMGCIGAGVATAHYDHIKGRMFHVKHSLLTKTETGKDLVEDLLYIDAPHQGVQSPHRRAQLFRGKLGAIRPVQYFNPR
ncbi:hypothetical protein PSA7680_01029 [Pseudoruegeria aquimaris]|uniref:Uncharacterized protein n=1 Tax=Pseudoruegeria aquimaris TaxID=393663 RepID=A0A1Y5RSW7_9RHOB|nr:hypothetical protein PSA7680_01029 [Pseudoruegeria aquimaris]